MKNIVLSVSKINNFSLCKRLFFFSDVLDREPLNIDSKLESGSLFHELLKNHYNSKMTEKEIDFERVIDQARNYSSVNLDLDTEDIEKTLKLYAEYFHFYQYENWIPKDVEQSFIKEIYSDDDLRLFIEGKIDLIVETKNGLAVVDHKKTGYDSDPVDRDNQKLAYCWATGIKEFIINQCGTQKTKKLEDRLRRYYFRFTDQQIKEWEDSVIDIAFEMLDSLSSNRYPARYISCARFGRKCNFYEVCNSNTELWDWKLKTDFKKKDHNLFPKEKKNE